MANDNEIQLVATIDNDDSVSKIKSDISIISKKLNGQNVNFNITAKLSDESIKTIRSQLNSIKADLSNVDVGKIQTTINDSSIKTVQNNISTVYAEGAKQADVLHRKQLLLQQDYDILAEKIAKSNQNINTVATRDGVNYNAQFQQLMSGNIADNDTYNRARDALAAIRKEFQLLNAQFSSDLPENAIERYSNRVIKLKSDIDSLAQSYKESGLNNQQLKASIDSLSKMKDSLVIPQENDITTKEELSERTKRYTQIKNLVDETNIELAKQKKLEADFNKEFAQALKEEELAKQQAEMPSKLYWQDQFEQSVKSLTAENEELKKLKEYLREVDNEAKTFDNDITQANNKISTSLSKLNAQSNNATFRNNASNPNVSNQLGEIETLKARYTSLQQALSTTTNPKALLSIQDELKSLDVEFVKVTNSSKELQYSLRNENAFSGLEGRVDKLTASMNAFANANERAVNSTKTMSNGKTFANEWKEISEILSNGNLDANSLRNLQSRFQVFGKEAESAGLKGQTAWGNFANTFKSFSTYLSAYTVINTITNQIRQMTDEVIKIDTAMTDLKKVTEATDGQYSAFLSSSAKQAQNLHTEISDVVSQTAEWAKLGYDLNDAQQLANISAIYSKVGDVDSATAVKDMVTAIKAFNIEVEDSIGIVDKFNILGNNFAVSSGELGDGLAKSASAMSVAGNTIEQTLALLAGATEITQDVNATSNALKIISLRIRGMKGELQALNEETDGIESISKIQTQILNLTNNKVNIFDENNNFKSTYDILKEISDIYFELEDTAKANLTEILFGKNRANQGIAVLQAFQSGQIESAYKTALNSAGSAQKEFDELGKSIESHINDFKAAYQGLAQTLIKSDAIKAFVDAGTNALNIIQKLIENTKLLTIVMSDINPIGVLDIKIIKFTSELSNFIKASKNAEGAIKSLGYAFKGLGNLIEWRWNISPIGQISNLIDKLTDKLKEYNNSQENAKKATENALLGNEDIINSEAQIDSLIAEYTALLNSTEDTKAVKEQLLALQNKLNGSYENEVEGLDLVNNSYGENLKLLRERNDLLRQNWIDENQDAINNAKQELFGYREVDLGNLSFTSYGVDNALSALNSMIDAFEQADNSLAGIYSGLMPSWDYVTYNHALETRDALLKQKEEAKSLYDIYRQYTDALSSNAKISESDYQTFNNLVEKYKSLQNTLSTTDSLVTMGNTSKELQLVEKELNAFGDKSIDARNMVNSFFENFKTGSRETADVMAGNLEEYEKELGTIDKFNNAIKTLAGGGRVSAKDIWDLIDSDTEHQITFLDQSTEGITTNLNNMVKAKDAYIEAIKKSVIARQQENIVEMESIKKEIKLLEAKRTLADGIKVNSPADVQDFVKTTKQINLLNSKMKDFQKAINDDNLFIDELNANLGRTADVVSNLKDMADDYLNAYKDRIDEITDGLEKEKDVLEKQKDELNEQLDILKEQQKQIEDVIKSYDDLADYIKDIVQEEIDGIKDRKQEQEDAYEERIEQIKNTYDTEINRINEVVDQRKKSLEIQEKELALKNARNTKQRVYSAAEGGFTYQADVDAVESARKDLLNTYFDNSTSEHIAELEKQRDELVKQVEAERDLKIKDFDSEIEELENYADAWAKANKIISDSDSETLAKQIFGSNYREQIKRKDTNVLNTFKNNYVTYNKDLENLVNGEMATLEKSIKAKEDEIKAKEAQIQSWQDYKTEVENAAKDIENSLNGYSNLIKQVALDENSTFADRAKALENFKNNYTNMVSNIESSQKRLQDLANNMPSFHIESNLNEIKNQLGTLGDDLENYIVQYKDSLLKMDKLLRNSSGGYGVVNSAWDAKMARVVVLLRELMPEYFEGYSQGGVADYTGTAMLHGTSQRSETIFNATDSKKLYDIVHGTNNLSDIVGKNLLKSLPNNVTTNNNNNGITNNFQFGNVIADNPVNFAKQMERYWRDVANKK